MRTCTYTIVALVAIGFFTTSYGLAFDPKNFDHLQVLGNNVTLYWTAFPEKNLIKIGVAAPVTAWLSIGKFKHFYRIFLLIKITCSWH